MMTIGERIKQRRKELGISVDQMADVIGKNRATIYRYECDDIENMPVTVLEPLASVLCTTPAYLMGWDLINTEQTMNDILIKENSTSYNVVRQNPKHQELLENFNKLSNEGKEEAIKRVKELTFIPLYCNGGN